MFREYNDFNLKGHPVKPLCPVGKVRSLFIEQPVKVGAVAFSLAVNDAPNLILNLHQLFASVHCSRINRDVDSRIDEVVEHFRLFFIVDCFVKEDGVFVGEVKTLTATCVMTSPSASIN